MTTDISASINTGWNRLLNLFLPPGCVLCRDSLSSHQLCLSCWQGLTVITSPCCSLCGVPLAHEGVAGEHRCAGCMVTPPELDSISAYCVYNDISRHLILPFKHAGRLDRTILLAQMMSPLFKNLVTSQTLVMPMPLHWQRYLFRLYNQSAELARILCRRSQLSDCFAPDILRRQTSTPPMMRMSVSARKRTVRGVFCINPHADKSWKDKDILIIDDVMTTGASLNECAKTLRKAGHNASISGLVFARVVQSEPPIDVSQIDKN